MSEEVTLKPCPFCGGKAFANAWEHADRMAYKYAAHVICRDCQCAASGKGFYDTEDLARNAAVAAWNRRTPEPGTSVVRWTRHNGTEETLPPIYQKVLLRDADSFAQIPMRTQGRRHDFWIFEDGTRRDIEIGDEWVYWAELLAPPEEANE